MKKSIPSIITIALLLISESSINSMHHRTKLSQTTSQQQDNPQDECLYFNNLDQYKEAMSLSNFTCLNTQTIQNQFIHNTYGPQPVTQKHLDYQRNSQQTDTYFTCCITTFFCCIICPSLCPTQERRNREIAEVGRLTRENFLNRLQQESRHR